MKYIDAVSSMAKTSLCKTSIWSWSAVTVISYVLSWALIDQAEFIPPKAALMIQAVVIIVSGYFLYPDAEYSSENWLTPASWSLMLAITALLISAIQQELHLLPAIATKSALAVFLLSYFMLSVSKRLLRIYPGNRSVPNYILYITFALGSLPIWITPCIETLASTQTRLHIVLWSSPLSYLAGMLDYDYLRSQWFYRHTAYGMLRYEYPDATTSSLALLGISLMLQKPRTKHDAVID